MQAVVAVVAGLLSFGFAAFRRGPNDYTLGATVLITVFLLIQIVLSIVRPFFGDWPNGDGLEYWMYLITAVLMPPIAAVWALVDRGVWANVVLGVVQLSIAVMVWRMWVIWS